MEGEAPAGWSRWRLWALCLPFSLFLWNRPATGMETTASPSPAPAMSCAAFTKKTCEECVKNTKCLWCSENSTCMDYPVSKLIPPSSLCELKESYWGVCFVNFEAIIITIGVVAGLLLLLIVCCCCYCCCRHRPSRQVSEEEERFIRDREEKRMQSLQRKHERKVKHDEIRKKYVNMFNPFVGNFQHYKIERNVQILLSVERARDEGLLPDSDHPYSRYENE